MRSQPAGRIIEDLAEIGDPVARLRALDRRISARAHMALLVGIPSLQDSI